MADKLDGILSAMYFHPALEALRTDPRFAAWSNTPRVEEVLLRILVIARASDVAVVSTDFSDFDTSVPMPILDVVFDAIRLWFTSTPGLDLLQDSFTSGGLLCPDGLYTGRLGAIPSGSGLTGFMGTMVNVFCAIYVAHRAGSSLLASTYLGDDAVNVYRPQIAEDRIQEYGSELNLDLNADKQYVAKTSAHYLQYVFELEGNRLMNGGGVRTFGRNLQGMLNYERRRRDDEWTPSMASIRTIMQLENSLHHPEFLWLVKFATQGDRRLLEMPVSRLVQEAGGTSKIIEVLGIASYRYGSRDVSGLEAFETVRVLNTLR
jgi:hypothetical protein